MPKISKHDATDVMELEGYEGHFGELGDFTVGFETYTADADLAELFKGLPEDRCQCPHWGVVLKGRLKYTDRRRRDDRSRRARRTTSPPGHLPYLYAGTEVVEFSPTEELQKTLEVIEKNMAAAG